MNEVVTPIAVIGGIKYYNENDLLKPFFEGETECYPREHHRVRGFSGYWLSYCPNSVPAYLRVQECIKEHQSWFENLGAGCSFLQVEADGVVRYEKWCPKVAWGVAAFVLMHSVMDEWAGVMYSLEQDNDVDVEELFSAYFEDRKRIYQEAHKNEYRKYSKRTDIIARLDEAFINGHIEDEEKCLKRTSEKEDVPECLKPLFDNAVKKASDYLEWVEKQGKDIGEEGEQSIVEQSTNNTDVTGETENVSKYPDGLLALFKNNECLIDGLTGSDDEIAVKIKTLSKERDKFGKPMIKNPYNRLMTEFAKQLKKAGIISCSERTFRDKLST